MHIKNWLVLLFILGCGMIFERAVQSPLTEYTKLHIHLMTLLQKKRVALDKQQELKRYVNSLNDASWIEFILIKELGLVPDKQMKFVFEDTS